MNYSASAIQEANAADLPAELVHEFLSYLTIPTFANKRGLASCSLVCRHWAKLITPVLFQGIILRNAEDVAELVSFIDAPARIGLSLADFIEEIDVKCRGPQTSPWLHHLRALWERCQNLREHVVEIDNVSAVSARLKQPLDDHFSLSCALPRTLPRSCYTPLGNVHLSNLVLHHPNELVALLDSLPGLQQSLCERVTFRNSEPRRALPRRPLALRSHIQDTAEVAKCGDGTAEMQFDLAASILEPCERLGLATDVGAVLLRAAHALLPWQGCSFVSVGTSRSWDRADGPYQAIIIAFGGSGLDERLIITYDVPGRPTHAGALRQVSVVEIEIYGDRAANVGWSNYLAFDEALFELDEVPSTVVTVRQGAAGFRSILDAVLRGTFFGRLRSANKFSLTYDPDGITMTAILNSPSEHMVDDVVVTLSPVERFDYLLLQTAAEKDSFLRRKLPQ